MRKLDGCRGSDPGVAALNPEQPDARNLLGVIYPPKGERLLTRPWYGVSLYAMCRTLSRRARIWRSLATRLPLARRRPLISPQRSPSTPLEVGANYFYGHAKHSLVREPCNTQEGEYNERIRSKYSSRLLFRWSGRRRERAAGRSTATSMRSWTTRPMTCLTTAAA